MNWNKKLERCSPPLLSPTQTQRSI